MVRRCIRDLTADGSHPEWQAICDVMVGNLGFMFTNGPLDELEEVVKEFVKPAAAKAGVIAPVDCVIPKGPTGLDPAQTSFFQALNIATKINKGSIEIINDCKVLTEGGVFDPSVLKITDSDLIAKFAQGVANVATLSM